MGGAMMAAKARVKFMIFLGALVIAVPGVVISVSLVAQFVAYFQQGADPASIFHGHALIIPEAESARWANISQMDGTAPSLPQQEEIISAYWLAWEALGRAQQTDDLSDLPTYWAGSAYTQVVAGMPAEAVQLQSHSGHTLHLSFFSADGSVAAFEDRNFSLVMSIHGISHSVDATASVVMTLDQGFWRIRQIEVRYQDPN